MQTHRERGMAMVLALFIMTALSALGASLMFLSQTEIYSSMNYRMMSQGRYAAESGVQKAANFLFDTAQYQPPGPHPTAGAALPNALGDSIDNYIRTASPVTTLDGTPVVLSFDQTKSNYPIGAVKTSFANLFAGANGTLTGGNAANISYNATATLVAMQQFFAYDGTWTVVQTWQIVGSGSVTGARTAVVQVSSLVETPKVPANSYAAFATDNGCDAMYLHGSVSVDSYDSSKGTYAATQEDTGGDVGTNGNLKIQGATHVDGNLYTPRTGVGSCAAGAVTGLTMVGGAGTLCNDPAQNCVGVSDSMVQLPGELKFPPPVFSTTPPTTAITIDSTLLSNAVTGCAALGSIGGVPLLSGVNCTVDAANKTVTVNANGADLTMGSITVGDNYHLIIAAHDNPPQTVNINSLVANGNGNKADNALQINATAGQSVVLKVSGKNADGTEMATAVDMNMNSWKQNSPQPLDAAALQIVYGGTQAIQMGGGNSQQAAVLYAPNAAFTLKGTQDWFGSILGKTVTNGGNVGIHYDRSLAGQFFIAGRTMGGAFSWARF